MSPSGSRSGARSRLLGLAGPVALALAGVAFAVVPAADALSSGSGVTLRGWIEVPSLPPNPDARDNRRTLLEDASALTIAVLANDRDQDGSPGKDLEITFVGDPRHGSAILVESPGSRDQIAYTPDPNYCNSDPVGPGDTFAYEIKNSLGFTDRARVFPTVTCVDDGPPVPNDDPRTVTEDSGTTSLDVLTNDSNPDGDPIEITGVADPQNGSAAVVQGSPDRVSYTPDADYCNDPGAAPEDTFTYTVTGGDTATVSVTVTCVNDDPVANDDSRTVGEDDPATNFNVLTNDTDADGDAIEITGVSDPARGTAAVVQGSPDQVSYAPDADYCNDPGAAAEDTFTYTVTGGDTATVSVTVTCVNDNPVANDDARTVGEDDPATNFNVLTNDTDADGDAIEITGVSDPARGTAAVVQGSPDQVSYAPDADYCNDPGAAAEDTFTYTVTGGDTATVSVTVTCVDDGPTAVDDARTVAEGSGASAVDVLANDTDTDGGPGTVDSVTQPSNGTVAITDAGARVTYTPKAGYCNEPGAAPTDDFAYTVNGGDSATVAATVTCVDDAQPQPKPTPTPDPACKGLVATKIVKVGEGPVKGTPGRDVIFGSAGADRIDGAGGDDVICANGGDDRVTGGKGGDRISGFDGADRLSGSTGDDRVSGAAGEDRVSGNAGDDRVVGGDGNDRVSGNDGRDRVSGNGGDDRVGGGAGRDVLYGRDGDDELLARDTQRDFVACENGRDTATTDRVDATRACETTKLAAARRRR